MLYNAEAYQVYHGHSVALALQAQHGIEVSVLYNDVATPRHLDRIERAFGEKVAQRIWLRPAAIGRAIQTLRVFGLAKTAVLAANLELLSRFDAIVSLERDVAILRRLLGPRCPPLIYVSHGAGDRSAAWNPRTRAFDLALVSGEKTRDRLIALGLTRPDAVRAVGYIKMDVADRIGGIAPVLFEEARPVVLYNPHKAPKQSSWNKAIGPMLAQFANQRTFNLIVAPHVKMFRRRRQRVRDRWNARSTPNVHFDTGSDNCVDGTYVDMADIYVGDVSSQVYEFTARPRPCVFLNMHGAAWRGDAEYRFWEMGEVVDRPADILPAIARATARHAAFIDVQRDLTAASLGDTRAGASLRAAQAIVELMASRFSGAA